MPEEYGGSDLDKTTAAIVVDYLAFSECASIMVTLAHSGIGALPIVWYGNEEQKKKYYLKSHQVIGLQVLRLLSLMQVLMQ